MSKVECRCAVALVAAVALALVPNVTLASLVDFTFTYNDVHGDSASGTLVGDTATGIGDDGFHVIGGAMTVASTPAVSPKFTGTYVLADYGPTPTLVPYASSGGTTNVYVDNMVYPNGDAATGNHAGSYNGSLTGNPSYLTNAGLLFVPGGASPGSAPQIFFFGQTIGGLPGYFLEVSLAGGFGFGTGQYNSFTLSLPTIVTPEPASIVVFGTGTFWMFLATCRRRKI